MKRIAVITDVLSPDFTFPIWMNYYGSQFGLENLFLVTYKESQGSYQEILPQNVFSTDLSYNDDVRPTVIEGFVERLLANYDIVVRVDVDEMLVVDPVLDGSLSQYIHNSSFEYITALGLDLIQGPEDKPLDISCPVLEQRSLCFALTAMNKTCVTRRALRWGRGFHYCTVPPKTDRLYLFHLKRVDIVRQVEWARGMSARLPAETFERKYYSEDMRIGENFVKSRWTFPAAAGEDALQRNEFNGQFNKSIRLTASSGIYDGPYDIEKTNVIIPTRFRSVF